MNLYHGDCLEVLPTFPPASVEAIITDLPYGTTACEWDSIIPLAPMWEQVQRVLKPNGAFITTSCQPFTSVLVTSNLDFYRYQLVWEKPQGVDPFMTNIRPLNNIESIEVFGKGKMTYNPQLEKGEAYKFTRDKKSRKMEVVNTVMKQTTTINNGFRYPMRVVRFNQEKGEHPTQKPVSLYEYLIRTYTNPSETVLDICMGSGTTGVAAVQTGRNFIGIEKEQKYFEIASRRIAHAPRPLFVESPRQPTTLAPDAGKAAAQNTLFE